MLTLDTTTQSEVDLQATVGTKLTALQSALANPITVRVYNAAGTQVGSGTLTSPGFPITGSQINVAAMSSFSVSTSGTPDPATWYLRFESGSRWLRGSFGLANSGADFRWSSPAWTAGQAGQIGTVVLTITLTAAGTFGWTALTDVNLGTVSAGGSVPLAPHAVIPPGSDPVYTLQAGASPYISVDTDTGVASVSLSATAADYTFDVDLYDANAGTGNLPSITLHTTQVGTFPWTVGQAFVKGAVFPGTLRAETNATAFQVDVRNLWNDGSIRYAVLSGISVFTGTAVTVALGTTGVLTSTTSIPESAVTATMVLSAVKDWSFGTVAQTLGATIQMQDGNGVPCAGTYVSHSVTLQSGSGSVGTTAYTAAGTQAFTITGSVTGGTPGTLTVFRLSLTYLDQLAVQRTRYVEVIGYVRAGGGLSWNGTANVPSAGNTLPDITFSLATARANGAMAWTRTTAHRVRSIPGPVMSEYHYYSPASTDSHLAVWWYVRCYATHTEVETVVENGWMYQTMPGIRYYTATLSVGGTQRFSGATQHLNFTKWSRVDWSGTDPQITPIPSMAYLKSTRMIQNWTANSQSEAQLAALGQNTYAWANQRNNTAYVTATSEGSWAALRGNGQFIGLLNVWDAIAVCSSDARAINRALAHARLAGRYQLYIRDETTGRMPRYVTDHPNASLSSVNWASEYGRNVYSAPFPNPSNVPVDGHKPDHEHNSAFGYFAYLLTGRWQYLEAEQFNAAWFICVFGQYYSGQPRGAMGFPAARSLGWSLRALSMAATMAPETLNSLAPPAADTAVRSELILELETTLVWNNNRRKSATFANNLGYPSSTLPASGNYAVYGDVFGWSAAGLTNYYRYAPFQIAYCGQGFGFTRVIEPPISAAAQTALVEYSDSLFLFATNYVGTNSTFNYKYIEEYTLPFGSGDRTSPLGNWIASWSALFTLMIQAVDAWVDNPQDHPASDTTGEAILMTPSVNPGGSPYPTAPSVAYRPIPVGEDLANFWGQRQRPVLAYAVDCGYTGAAASYARLANSSTVSANLQDFINYPINFVNPLT